MAINKWILIPPGGPQGPFWGVTAQNGNVKALQMANKEAAEFLVLAGNAAQCDFEIVRRAGDRLIEILARDFPDRNPDEMPISLGTDHYIIRAVLEAVFK